jgi:hypothetical protein
MLNSRDFSSTLQFIKLGDFYDERYLDSGVNLSQFRILESLEYQLGKDFWDVAV